MLLAWAQMGIPLKSRSVTLIRTPTVSRTGQITTDISAFGAPPLGLAYVAGALHHASYDVTVIDAVGEATQQCTEMPGVPLEVRGLTAPQIIARIPKDAFLIGVSCMFSADWWYCKRLLNAISEAFPGVPLILGGEHATADAKYILDSVPGLLACVCGEGEDTAVELADALQSGGDLQEVAGIVLRTKDGQTPTSPRKRNRRLDELPWPMWEKLPLENYLVLGKGYGVTRGRVVPMIASRGCPYRCTFCSNPSMWGKLWNVRSPECVVAEIKHNIEKYGATHITFWDQTMVIRREWIMEFAQMLIDEKLNIEWSVPSGTRSEAIDREVASIMLRAGCNKLSFAPESGSPEELKRIKKQVNLSRMLQTMRECSQAGMITKAHIIMGFPDSTFRDIFYDYVYMVKMAWAGVNDVPVYLFYPYPGSAIHDDLLKQGFFPPYGEEYDLLMAKAVFTNYKDIPTWNPRITPRMLRYLALSSMAVFYGSQFLFRPWRILESMSRLIQSKPVTMLERMPEVMIQRLRDSLRQQPAMQPTMHQAPKLDGETGL
jgi:anaerobic magnesium-protoporphyrin IX monomethyl ester cyclase